MKPLLTSAVLFLLCAQATAATYNIAAGTNLGDSSLVPSPKAGDVWVLQGDASLFDPAASPVNDFKLTLPNGAGLTIQAAAGGSTINLNNGSSAFGNFVGSGTVALNVVGDLHFTGGGGSVGLFSGSNLDLNAAPGGSIILSNNVGDLGGAIYDSNYINLGTVSGDVVLTDNHSRRNGGALYSARNSSLTIGNANSLVIITNNSAGLLPGQVINAVGGAVVNDGNANYPLILAGETMIVSNNQASGSGGAIRSTGEILVNGNLFADANTAGVMGVVADGGAFSSGIGVNVVGNTSMTTNATTGRGGAIFASVSGVSSGNIALSDLAGNVTLVGNIAGQDGGAVFANNGIDVAVGNDMGTVTITGNRAGYDVAGQIVNAGRNGGAIYNLGNGVGTMIRGSEIDLSDNHATGRGGAVFSDAPVYLKGSLMAQGNTAGTQGGAIWTGGSISLTAWEDMTFSGNTQGTAGTPQANALYMNNNGGSTTARFFVSQNQAISFFDPITSNAANGLLNVVTEGPGRVSFDGSLYGADADRWSNLYATTQVEDGTFEVANNAVYGVHASTVGQTAATRFSTAAGSTLQGGGSGTVIADQINVQGDLSVYGRQNARSVFTLDSQQLTFGPDSRVFVNTSLTAAKEPMADLLVLELGGSAVTGEAALHVRSLAGLGRETTDKGIKVVQGNNGTTASAFNLGNRVAAGAYDYNLFYGADPETGGDPTDQNWYLRSTLKTTNPDDADLPNYRDEVPVNMAVPAMLNRMGLAMLGTYNDRVGDAQYPATGGDAWERPATWTRVFGEQGSVAFGNSSSASSRLESYQRNGPSYDYTITGVAAGADLYRHDNADGTHDSAGAYFAAGKASSDVDGVYSGRAGSAGVKGYSLGGYWTRTGESGAYLDGVVQATWYDNMRTHSSHGEKSDYRAVGLLGSLEGGYPIDLGANVVFEPQAQVVQQHISIGDSSDRFGRIEQKNTNVTYGRVGARVAHRHETKTGHAVTTWVRANAWHSFGQDATTTFSNADSKFPVAMHTDLGGTWGQVGAGVSGQVHKNLEVFVSGDYNQAMGHGTGHGMAGQVGLNWSF